MPDRYPVARVLVVDDHELVRKGLCGLLPPECEVCGEASNGEEALEKLNELRPDIMLLDYAMPVMTGSTTARYVHMISPKTKVVLISVHDTDTVEQLAKAVHADAFLSKSCSVKIFRKTIADLMIAPSAFDLPDSHNSL